MTNEVKIAVFENELNLIKDDRLRDFVKDYLLYEVPDYFWEIGASSSGKYHPKFSQNKGGLVRHTKAVVKFADELLRVNQFGYISAIEKDYVIMACILHDTAKYGKNNFNKDDYANHPSIAAQSVADFWFDEFSHAAPYLLINAIASHMGQWGEAKMMTSLDRCVHLADYIASRSFIDIPDIVTEFDSAVDSSSLSYASLQAETKALYSEG